MADVLLKQLTKTYPSQGKQAAFEALKPLDLEIQSGEFHVLIGPSGCGKSTTLRLIAGLEKQTSGEIWIGGRCVNQLAPAKRNIAMVFQNYALYPHMRVWDNIAFGLKMSQLPAKEIAKRVALAAEMLGLEKLLDRRPSALSGGQRQRVAVGRAIVRKPSVFLFDEPLSNLDAKMRIAMRSEIIALHKRLKATMIYVTHDQTEAMTMGSAITLLKEGVVQQSGAPLALYNKPANPFVAGFLGSPPMNLFHVEKGDSGSWFIPPQSAQNKPVFLSLRGDEVDQQSMVVGIRPQHIELVCREESQCIKARLQFVEPLGSEFHLHIALESGHACVVTLYAMPSCQVGDDLCFTFNTRHLHFFSS